MTTTVGSQDARWAGVGLIGILTVIAAVVLLVTGRYPDQIFDFVLGMNRWVLRVAAYAGLMTDRYPPFRLDMGGQADGGPARPTGWTTARIVSVTGAVLALVSLDLLAAGGTALWAQAQKQGGYVGLGTTTYSGPGYAITSDALEMHMASGGWDGASALIGTVRIRVTKAGGSGPVFAGIAPAAAAQRYLTGVAYATVTGSDKHQGSHTEYAGSAPAVPPAAAGIWAARAAGPGTQTLTWPARSGDWMVVAMNADGSRPVSLQANVAATLPALPEIAGGLLAGGFVFLAAGVLLIAVPLRRATG